MSKPTLHKKFIMLAASPVLKKVWNAVYCVFMLLSCIVRTFVNPALLFRYSDRFTEELLRPFDAILTTTATRFLSLGAPLVKSALLIIKRLTLFIISG